jgi:hypothetical protein
VLPMVVNVTTNLNSVYPLYPVCLFYTIVIDVGPFQPPIISTTVVVVHIFKAAINQDA